MTTAPTEHVLDESLESFLNKMNQQQIPSSSEQLKNPDMLYQLTMDGGLRVGRMSEIASVDIMTSFSIKLLLDNIPRLTDFYNKICLPNLKKHFPQFYQDFKSAESDYVQEALVPCEMTHCDDEEFKERLKGRGLHEDTINRAHRDYEAFRSTMRKKRVTFDPVTSDFIRLLAAVWRYAPTHNPLMCFIQSACVTYDDGQGCTFINGILRSVKDYSLEGKPYNTQAVTKLLPGLLFPFRSNHELVVYRADNMEISTDFLVVKGMLSSSLSLEATSRFGDERVLKIIVPPGTLFLPTIVFENRNAEITLLPGTELELVKRTKFAKGSFVEYRVTKNPPKFEEKQIATILRAAISGHMGHLVWNVSRDVPSDEEQNRFIYNLVNKKYGGDW